MRNTLEAKRSRKGQLINGSVRKKTLMGAFEFLIQGNEREETPFFPSHRILGEG